jgi:uncharacterized delta-60 repeat protein
MTRKLLRIALPVLCMALAQCTASTTTSSGPPTAFATLRLNATTGVGDSTFGPNKTIVVSSIDPTLNDFALAVAIQSTDNKLVVAGSNGLAGQGQIALIRYNADGSLDTTTFGTTGTGGIVRTTLGSPALASAVAVQANGKIVVAALIFTPATSVTSMAVLRYNTDGTLDTSFNTNGISAPTAIGSGLAGDVCAMLLQSATGNIVVAGATQDGKLVLARYTSAGAPDTTFGTSGTTVTPLAPPATSPTHTSPSMAAQSDGRIIVVTRSGDDQAVLRYSVDGVQDTGFGGGANNGVVITDIGGSVNYADAVAIQDASGAPSNTDNIIVAGHTDLTANASDISLVRYSKDGALDKTFNTTGIVTTDIFGQFDNAIGVLMQDQAGAEPKILVSGNTGFGSATQTFVFRYNSDGSGDVTFGSRATGLVLVPNVGPSTVASGNAMAIQNGGGIIVTGYD